MTSIERAIFAELRADEVCPAKLEVLAALYDRAHTASHRVYRKIQWRLLDERIRERCGQAGLDYVRQRRFEQ